MDIKMDVNEWLETGKYLPAFLRDFHEQKKYFKKIDNLIWHADAMGPKPNWIIAQIYVIDIFLFYMARRGYTLQKSKANVEFKNLED